MKLLVAALISALALGACANKLTTDIDAEDASQASKVKFGTVLDARPVSVRSEESGAIAGGAMLGGGASALIGQTNGATLAGLVIGALAGSRLHRMIRPATPSNTQWRWPTETRSSSRSCRDQRSVSSRRAMQ